MNRLDLMRGLRWRATFSVLLLRRLTVKLSGTRQKLSAAVLGSSGGNGGLYLWGYMLTCPLIVMCCPGISPLRMLPLYGRAWNHKCHSQWELLCFHL